MLWSSKGYIDHFDWHPEEGTHLVVIDRASGAVREHVTEPFFAFHTVNAFERGDETVLDLLAYPDAGIVTALRIVMRQGVARARVEKPGEAGFEFPATNYKRVNGRAYRYVYGAANWPDAGHAYASALVKTDLDTGRSTAFGDEPYVFGEPVFVARPHGESEDDGVLLTVGSARDAETSELAVVDARTMTPIVRATVPSAIPLGFHGSFVH